VLVLSRRPGETLRIGDDIVVVVVGGGHGSVRLGIDAPPHVRVFRGEIYEALAVANAAAAADGRAEEVTALALGKSS
jgi:carbon storage regulator